MKTSRGLYALRHLHFPHMNKFYMLQSIPVFLSLTKSSSLFRVKEYIASMHIQSYVQRCDINIFKYNVYL